LQQPLRKETVVNEQHLPVEIRRFVADKADKGTPIKVLEWSIYERTIEVEWRYDQTVRATFLRLDEPLSDTNLLPGADGPQKRCRNF
jgi:hypothetical protein